MEPQAVLPVAQAPVCACHLGVRTPDPSCDVNTLILPVPGVVTPFTTVAAPVGTWFNPSKFATAIKTLKGRVSYIMLPPARITVFPLPCMSQAMPKRGEKLLRSGLKIELMPCPTWTSPTDGRKLPNWLLESTGTEV